MKIPVPVGSFDASSEPFVKRETPDTMKSMGRHVSPQVLYTVSVSAQGGRPCEIEWPVAFSSFDL